MILDDVDHADVLNPILREKGIKSMLGVPLLVAGDAIGVIHVGTLTPRSFGSGDVELLQLAADRAAIAIEHARLFEAERRARERVEHVQAVTDAALAHLERRRALVVLLPRIRDILARRHVRGAAARRGGERARGARRGRDRGGGRAGRAHPRRRRLRRPRRSERRPVILDDVDHADVLNPILREKGIKSMLGVPLLVARRRDRRAARRHACTALFTATTSSCCNSSPSASRSRSSGRSCTRRPCSSTS